MTTYSWPTTLAHPWLPKAQSWRQTHNNRVSVSSLSGATQTISLPGARWGVTLEWPDHSYAERASLEGFISRLSGREHRLSLWDLTRPQRRGTCNLTGVTASAAAQFATAMTLNGCGVSTTLKAGDWFAITTSTGSQLLQVVADATANASGVMAVEVRQMLRGSVSASAAVTLDRPAALFILTNPDFVIPRGGSNRCPGFLLDFVEVFA